MTRLLPYDLEVMGGSCTGSPLEVVQLIRFDFGEAYDGIWYGVMVVLCSCFETIKAGRV